MRPMFVTLEVSKLSGWLNAVPCRESNGGHTMQGEGAGGREAEGAWSDNDAGGMQERGFGAYGTRGAHQKHAFHACDAGCVETQRLVERRRQLSSRNGCYEAGRGARKGTEEGSWLAAAQVVCRGKARVDIGRMARARGAPETCSSCL